MQRNWKPVFVVSDSDDSKGRQAQTFSHILPSEQTADGDGRSDLRFAIGASLLLGVPALIGAGIFLIVNVVLRMS
jgi:hypothetical protein